MAPEKDHALKKARELIALLKSSGIDIYEAFMFGSAAIDKIDEYSDIDVAIVSKDFTGEPFYDVKKISKFRRAVDLKLEVHTFSLSGILENPPLFFLEIKSKGIPIRLAQESSPLPR